MEYVSISEAAKRLSVSVQTLRRWDNSGKFRSGRHPVNNYRVYTTGQLDQFVAELESPYQLSFHRRSMSELTPFFQTSLGACYHTDCVDFLQRIPDASIDLIVADPPYNIRKAQWDTFESQRAYIHWSMSWIEEAARALSLKGSLYICGFSEILADLKWSASHLFKGCKWLVWYYRNKANMVNDWGRSHESVLHFRKSRDFIFNVDDVRVPYNMHTLKYPRRPQAATSQYGNGKAYDWTPNPKGAKPKDVFEIPTISNHAWEKYEHPTQKPVELMKKFILASSYEGSKVVDPFGGSGTTFVVAEALNREWLGSDNSESFCAMAKARLSDKEHIRRIATGKDERESVARRSKLRGRVRQ